jgi:hypothetical protein
MDRATSRLPLKRSEIDPPPTTGRSIPPFRLADGPASSPTDSALKLHLRIDAQAIDRFADRSVQINGAEGAGVGPRRVAGSGDAVNSRTI